MRAIVTLAALGICVTGCAAGHAAQPIQVTEKVGQLPELNSSANASVGSVMYSQYRYWSKPGYRLLAPLSTSIGAMLGRVQTEAGDFVAPAVAGGVVAYCTEKRAVVDPRIGPITKA